VAIKRSFSPAVERVRVGQPNDDIEATIAIVITCETVRPFDIPQAPGEDGRVTPYNLRARGRPRPEAANAGLLLDLEVREALHYREAIPQGSARFAACPRSSP